MSGATSPAMEMSATFALLKPLLHQYEAEMIVVHDTPETYYLDTRSTTQNGSALNFGSVSIKKAYVSFHLFPVYVYPDLLEGIGDVKRRMQGKSCFNFKKIDGDQLAALDDLVRASHDRFRNEGLI